MRVKMSLDDDPQKMWDKLVEAYSGTFGNTKRLLWDNVRSKLFIGENESMIDHISILEMYFGQLESIGALKYENLHQSILIDSVGVHPDYKQVVKTLRVGSEDLKTWKETSKRLISTYLSIRESKGIQKKMIGATLNLLESKRSL